MIPVSLLKIVTVEINSVTSVKNTSDPWWPNGYVILVTMHNYINPGYFTLAATDLKP